jgi:hypothetical protein
LTTAIQPFADRYGLTADVQRYKLELIKRAAVSNMALDTGLCHKHDNQP